MLAVDSQTCPIVTSSGVCTLTNGGHDTTESNTANRSHVMSHHGALSHTNPIDSLLESVTANLRRATKAVQFRSRLVAHCLARRAALITPQKTKENFPKNIVTIDDTNNITGICDTSHNSWTNGLRLSTNALARVILLGMDVPPDIIMRRNKYPSNASNKMYVSAGGGLGAKSIFVCGQDGVMIRSNDRGKSWRRVALPRISVIRTNKISTNTDDTDVSNIQSDGNIQKPSGAPNLSDGLSSDLLHVSSHSSGNVAVCGRDGYLAISIDKGCHFTAFPVDILHGTFTAEPSSNSGIKRKWFIDSKKKGPYPYVDIVCVEFLSDTEIVFCAANGGIFTSAFNHKYLHVEFEPSIHVVGAATPENSSTEHISLLVKSKEIIVSTPSKLIFCHSSCVALTCLWRTYVVTTTIPHNCGTIRAIVELTGNIPEIQQSYILSKISEDIEREAGRLDEGSGMKKKAKMSYASSVEVTQEAADKVTESRRYFHIFASNGHIVPFDFSALLCITKAPSRAASKEIIILTAVNIAFTPMVSTVGIAQKMGVGAYSIVTPKGEMLILLKSNGAGISASDDLGVVWSAPSHAFTRNLLILSDTKPSPRPPMVIACGSQCVLLSDVGFYPIRDCTAPIFEILPVPNSFRIKQISSVAAFF
eukprot:Tbor_TRINITY_DN5491_c0_g2::TRINITY_DN5491_c0_g2_i1::g.25362::m.25362